MPYTAYDGSYFEQKYPHRDTNNRPGISEFERMVREHSGDINTYLQVDEDICDYLEETQTSETIAKVIHALLEATLVWLDARRRTPSMEVAKLDEPDLFQDRYAFLRHKLETIKGIDESIEGSSFLFGTRERKGEGFEF